MKKIAVLLCVVATLLSFFVLTEEYTYGVYEITFTASIISNNSVGSEWKEVYTCDDLPIANGMHWVSLLDSPKKLAIDVTVTEKDKHPDIGIGSLSVDLKDDFEASTIITVTESNGRFKDNTAQVEIICKAELIEKL